MGQSPFLPGDDGEESSATQFASLAKKTYIAAAVVAIGRYSVKAMAKTLDVARSNLFERLGKRRSEWTVYRKTGASRLLPLIKELLMLFRPTVTPRYFAAQPKSQSG